MTVPSSQSFRLSRTFVLTIWLFNGSLVSSSYHLQHDCFLEELSLPGSLAKPPTNISTSIQRPQLEAVLVPMFVANA